MVRARALGVGLAIVAVIAAASPAAAQSPRPVVRTGGGDVVLAGDRVVLADYAPDGRARVRSLAFTGGSAATLLTYGKPVRHDRDPYPTWTGLGASTERVSAIVDVDDDHPRPRQIRTDFFDGPASGPLSLFERRPANSRGMISREVWVEGTRQIVFEIGTEAARLRVREPGRPDRFTPLPGVAYPVEAAGDFVAYGVAPGSGTWPNRVRLLNWATRERIADIPLGKGNGVRSLAVRDDGLLAFAHGVLGSLDEHVSVLAPGETEPRRLAPMGRHPEVAGPLVVDADHVVTSYSPGHTAARYGVAHLVALPLDGSPSFRVSPPSASLGGFDLDSGRLAWTAGGCVLTAPLRVAEGPAAAAGPGPCPRAEVAVDNYETTVSRAGRVRIGVLCVAAAARECRGRVQIGSWPGIGSAPFRIAAGRRRGVMVPLSGHARRRLARDGLLTEYFRATAVDAAGRRFSDTGVADIFPRG